MWESGDEQMKKPAQTISPLRQTQFIQAILILVGFVLGNSFSPWFYFCGILVGMELLVASLNDGSPLGSLIAKLPWNKPLPEQQN
jgi:hypothetical protein